MFWSCYHNDAQPSSTNSRRGECGEADVTNAGSSLLSMSGPESLPTANEAADSSSQPQPSLTVNALEERLPELTTKDSHSLGVTLARWFNSLSVEERNQATFDVHGVNDIATETPDLQCRFLWQMDEILTSLKFHPNLPTDAYRLAEQKSMAYVHNPALKLSFLRAVEFADAHLAAERYIRFYNFKNLLFGPDCLVRDLTWNDLCPADQQAYEKGYLQLLPERDSSNRLICVYFPNLDDYDDATQFGRLLFYNCTNTSSTWESERKGIIVIVWVLGQVNIKKFVTKNYLPVTGHMDNAMPYKLACLHLCYNDSLFNAAWKYLFDFTRDPVKKARCRCHVGTPQEVLYELMTFGIPSKAIPITDTGELQVNWHLMLLEMKQRAEAHVRSGHNSESTTFILVPSNQDVLFGRGRRIQSFPGNIRLKVTVEELLPEYETLDKEGKTKLAERIVLAVKEGGARFLSQEKGAWTETTDDLARLKVAQLFRNRRKTSTSSGDNAASTTEKKYADTVDGACPLGLFKKPKTN
ncbi:hypothetical protein IV203_023616 [Nitzschia inconspicua]|uniref:DUF6824 domain-containing protein n=1 Tax=Nitzschia inconspicua TaxID=303405 RepID=A0A9K3KDJ3_9STRA|nr:hypothetical protein IV203_023616 [Nitzschia inconspicua]